MQTPRPNDHNAPGAISNHPPAPACARTAPARIIRTTDNETFSPLPGQPPAPSDSHPRWCHPSTHIARLRWHHPVTQAPRLRLFPRSRRPLHPTLTPAPACARTAPARIIRTTDNETFSPCRI